MYKSARMKILTDDEVHEQVECVQYMLNQWIMERQRKRKRALEN